MFGLVLFRSIHLTRCLPICIIPQSHAFTDLYMIFLQAKSECPSNVNSSINRPSAYDETVFSGWDLTNCWLVSLSRFFLFFFVCFSNIQLFQYIYFVIYISIAVFVVVFHLSNSESYRWTTSYNWIYICQFFTSILIGYFSIVLTWF